MTDTVTAVEPSKPLEGQHEGIDNIEARVDAAMVKLGIDPEVAKAHVLAALERAADAYERADTDAAKSFTQAEGIRLLAALHAL